MFRWVAIALIRIYQATLSHLFPPSCRFTPTCSNYAIGAIQRFGLFRGTFLTVRRLLKCHPGHPGGYDPVPASMPGRAGNETDLTTERFTIET